MTGTTIEAIRYTDAFADQWDHFVRGSKNGTFLFERGFMDYHADRFEDHSLVFMQADTIVALLPANISGGELTSHGGLTYGGIVSGVKMSAALMLDVFDALTAYLRRHDLTVLNYKSIPHIYHRQPAEEDLYALFRNAAHLMRADVSATVAMQRRLPFSSGKKDGVRKAHKAGLNVRESTDWAACWELLTQVLDMRHGVRPVHSQDEIELLASRFPGNIRLFGAFDGDLMISALVIFDCGRTVHVQYIASSDQGRRAGGVDMIVKVLLEEEYSDREWFDFGTSTTEGGKVLNSGLARQKEMFGARTILYQQFRLTV